MIRWLQFLRRSRWDTESTRELRSYVDLETEENIARGMSPDDAHRAALLQLGNPSRVREQIYELNSIGWLDALVRDARYGLRRLAATPVYSVVAVLTLAAGIAINTTVFSVINAVLLQPMAARDPDRIVSIFTSTDAASPYRPSSYPEFSDINAAAGEVLTGLAVTGIAPVDLRGAVGARITAGTVSGNYFDVLGIGPIVGRSFTSEEHGSPTPRFDVILNEKTWREVFGGNPSILGRAIRLNNQVYTVIGVVARRHCTIRRFFEVDVFVPLSTKPRLTGESLSNRQARQYFLLGRLRPGVTVAQANSRMQVAAHTLASEDPSAWLAAGQPASISVVPERDSRVPPSARLGAVAFLSFMQAVVGIVLLIACTNLATAALARAMARQREMAVRLALGSTRWRLLQQLLTESLLLAALGCTTAWFLAEWMIRALMTIDLHLEVSLRLDLTLDHRVWWFTLATTVVTTLVAGLAPALQATRSDIVSVLKDTGDSVPGGRGAARHVLVAAAVAMSIMLLVPAGLFVRSVRQIGKVDLGFDPHDVALVSVSLDPGRYDAAHGADAYRRIIDRLRAMPQVANVDLASVVPLSGMVSSKGAHPADRPSANRTAMYNLVGAEYFATLRIPVLAGRAFTAADGLGRPPVAVVNQTFADALWPGQNAVGQRFALADRPAALIEVAGVVRTTKYEAVNESATAGFYLPILQEFSPEVVIHIRTPGVPGPTLQAFAAAVQSVDPTLTVYAPRTMDQQLAPSLGSISTAATILTILGAAGLALACTGLYTVVAYSTSRRRREIAIRIAIGASRIDVLRLLMSQGMTLVGIGLAVGLPASGGLALLISSFLFAVQPIDLRTYAGASLLLVLAAMGAVFMPAYRAACAEPADVLRAP